MAVSDCEDDFSDDKDQTLIFPVSLGFDAL